MDHTRKNKSFLCISGINAVKKKQCSFFSQLLTAFSAVLCNNSAQSAGTEEYTDCFSAEGLDFPD